MSDFKQVLSSQRVPSGTVTIKNKTMKARTVKQAMENDMLKVKNIHSKYSKKIRVDFASRFPNSAYKFQSFWIDRDYFQRNYPNTYDRF